MTKTFVETPLMKQYVEMKSKHPDAILLFRVGDFYETFSDDAIAASEILGITLTRRANGSAQHIELAGFPHHALDNYLPRLVRAGRRVAICEQLEDPKMTKKLVKRGIIELVTPGVSINDQLLERKENNFLAAIHWEKSHFGVSFLDISTGDFFVSEGDASHIDKLLHNFAPKEVLYCRGKGQAFEQQFGTRFCTFQMEDWVFSEDAARERLLKQFETKNLKGFGVDHFLIGLISSGVILYYLDQTQHRQISHINSLVRLEEERFVRLDRFTVRSLELLEPMNDGGGTLLKILDKTISPMGGRLLRRWIVFPLKQVEGIVNRQNGVAALAEDEESREEIIRQLSLVGDLERLMSKIAAGRISPRETVQLKVALSVIPPLKICLSKSNEPSLQKIGAILEACTEIHERIEREVNPEAPMLINRGKVINSGVNNELDQLRELAFSGKDYLLKIQQRESEQTGISSLKISFNNVFGYYIEVRNTHKEKVPAQWIRKQTLVNAERYITQELKEYEEKILGAEEKIAAIEAQLFNDLVLALSSYIPAIKQNAQQLATLDVLQSLATIAIENNYICPTVNEELTIDIKQGRHPVIEQQMSIGTMYVPNDLYLDNDTQQIIIITGPNMAGKSALLRQTALIVLMAQIGSFVPASAATIGVVDKVFTRVGASDNISQGESTFMVEMNEAANILNNLTPRSLILFDELGRGTSTYDGISIAWAIVEHIHQYPKSAAKTLFATHYHELNEMERSFKRIVNYNVSVKEEENKVIFMRKLVRGGSQHSFGIHVAKMAGMPPSIVHRSNELLEQMEHENRSQPLSKPTEQMAIHTGMQLSIFQLDDPLLCQIRDEIVDCDINNLTPMQALNKLHEVRKLILGK